MLTPAMQLAAFELATGKTMTAVSQAIKRHRSTILRWKSVPEFREALQRAQKEVKESIMKRLVAV